MISEQAPGKLYIAGEYAVVETGYPAIIVALNQFVTVSIETSEKYGSIVSQQYQENSIYWRRQGDTMVFDNRDNPFHYILSAIALAENYALQCGKKLSTYHLEVNSDLDSDDGKKYGLGSSAAVTVATVKALCSYYEIPMTKMQLFKLAGIAHLEVQGNGSLGDIAASVFGGWIGYRSFDKEWLKIKRRNTTLTELLNMPWPGLEINILTPPAELELLIGWTGTPASTSQLVDRIAIAKTNKQIEYQQFLSDSNQCIEAMTSGFSNQDLPVIQAEIRHNRQILQELADFSGVQIETPLLSQLCNLAEGQASAAKTSGAGGGDCGIALIDNRMDSKPLLDNWKSHGIQRLPLHVHEI